jgi:surface antigen
MTNLPTGTTGTTPTARRRLNRVITVAALAAAAVTAVAVPAQAAAAHSAYQVTAASDRRDCGGRPWDNGGRHRTGAPATCAPAARPSTPAQTPYTPYTPYTPAAPVTARGATITYNEGYAGSCVFYALDRFHQVTGVYPKAFGDARYLATGAAASGWATGSTPRINSLAVFQPGQNGAGAPTGHVAWVEQVSGNQIYVAEMNAPTAYVVTRRWLTPVSGVRYVYA